MHNSSGSPFRIRGGVLRTLLVNVVIVVVLLAGLELAARAYIAWTRGSQTAGLAERNVYLSYKPFVMYGPEWDDVLSPAKWPRTAGTCRVLLVGGSTAQGFPSAVLEEALARRFVGQKFEVINGAQGGYEGRQEVVVASVWGPRLEPDLLISLDGANDLEHRLRVKRAGRFYLDPTYEVYLTRPMLAPIAWFLSQSQLYNGIFRLAQRRALGTASQYADAIPVYVDAQRSLNALGRGLGASRLMVLQPHSAFKTPQSQEEAAFALYKYREEVMRVLYTGAAEQLAALAVQDAVAYLDGRFIYAGDSAQIFSDDVHLTPRGYDRLAEAMVTALADAGRARAPVCKTESPGARRPLADRTRVPAVGRS